MIAKVGHPRHDFQSVTGHTQPPTLRYIFATNFQIYPFCDLQLAPGSRLHRMNMYTYLQSTVCMFICDEEEEEEGISDDVIDVDRSDLVVIDGDNIDEQVLPEYASPLHMKAGSSNKIRKHLTFND